MTGKEKCNSLKAIRMAFADKNGIVYEAEECHHEGDCFGTCPKCEAEAAMLVEKLREKDTIIPLGDDEVLSTLGHPHTDLTFDSESGDFKLILTNNDKLKVDITFPPMGFA